jgi:hypothetical protein
MKTEFLPPTTVTNATAVAADKARKDLAGRVLAIVNGAHPVEALRNVGVGTARAVLVKTLNHLDAAPQLSLPLTAVIKEVAHQLDVGELRSIVPHTPEWDMKRIAQASLNLEAIVELSRESADDSNSVLLEAVRSVAEHGIYQGGSQLKNDQLMAARHGYGRALRDIQTLLTAKDFLKPEYPKPHAAAKFILSVVLADAAEAGIDTPPALAERSTADALSGLVTAMSLLAPNDPIRLAAEKALKDARGESLAIAKKTLKGLQQLIG